MASHQDVEFKTLDGITLRGIIYHATDKGAAVVLCPGVSLTQCLNYAALQQLLTNPSSIALRK